LYEVHNPGLITLGLLTLHYYANLSAPQHFFASPQSAALHPLSLYWIGGNEIRYVLFAVWSLNIFVFIIPFFLYQVRRHLNWTLAFFFLALTLPYACFMCWYIPHAGYICLLLPAFICAPGVTDKQLWPERRIQTLATIFVLLSLIQFFVARPIPFKATPSLILNTYVLPYTHRGIERGMFGNYQQWVAWMQGRTLANPARGTQE
jgi:hypothetical protein